MSFSTTLSTAVAIAFVMVLLPTAEPRQAPSSGRAAPLRFIAHTIDTELQGGYQTVVTDLNRDGRLDVIALASGLEDLRWYENPGWQKHVMGVGLRGMINLAAHDLDADGIPELALAHGFSSSYDRSSGIVSLLTHRGDPTEPWSIREIDRIPTAHRLRWADIDGTGSKVLINAPLAGAGSSAPEYRASLSLFWYRPGDWERQTVTDDEEGVVHGIHATSWGDPRRDAVLSASFLGVHAHRFDGGRWTKTRLVDGDVSPWPRSGASEIQVGHLEAERFLVTIEPWHGHQVVVYRAPSGADSQRWTRQVIDDALEDGHTIVAADLDADGRDEIVAGERGGNRSVYLYRLGDGPSDDVVEAGARRWWHGGGRLCGVGPEQRWSTRCRVHRDRHSKLEVV